MERNIVIHGDSLEYMKSLPDKCIDLILTDPPYWLDKKLSQWWWKHKNSKFRTNYEWKHWDVLPTQEYFDEIFRISKNQIIWGWNYFILPPTRWIICWDKNQWMPTFSAWELWWTSFDTVAKIFKCKVVEHWISRDHPTQKPELLFKWCLENYSKPWDLILDCFAWSWTTAVACIETWRDYIVIEKEADYVEIIKKRIKNTTPPLFIT